MYITCEQYEYLLESVTSSHEYYPSLSHCTFTREFFLSHPRIKRKKFFTTLSLQLEDEQHHRRPWCRINDSRYQSENGTKKKKKETYIIRKFESIAFTPSPREENFGRGVTRDKEATAIFFDRREGGREERRRKEERRWRMNGSFPFLVPPLPFTTRQSHASILLSRN